MKVKMLRFGKTAKGAERKRAEDHPEIVTWTVTDANNGFYVQTENGFYLLEVDGDKTARNWPWLK